MTNEFTDDRDVKIFSGELDDNHASDDSEYVRLINEKKAAETFAAPCSWARLWSWKLNAVCPS